MLKQISFNRSFNKNCLFPAVLAIIFFSLTLNHIRDVGTMTDESDHLGLIAHYSGIDFMLSGVGINIGKYPVLINYNKPYGFRFFDYINVFLSLFFDNNFMVLKILQLIICFLGLLALYYLIGELFNYRVSVILTLLFMTDLFFIHFSRIALAVDEPILNAFFYISMLFLLLFHRKKKNLFLYIAALIFGIGFNVKISMFARLIPLFIALFIIKRKEIPEFFKSIGIGRIIKSAIFFLLGASMMITYIFIKHPDKMKMKVVGTKSKTDILINIDQYTRAFKKRMSQLHKLVIGQQDDVFYAYATKINSYKLGKRVILGYIYYASLIINLLILLLFKKTFIKWRQILFFLYIFYGLMFTVSVFSPGTISAYHLFSLMPFYHFILALNISQFSLMKTCWKNIRFGISVIAVCILLVFNLKIYANYHRTYKETGGIGLWSNYTVEAVSYCKEKWPDTCFTSIERPDRIATVISGKDLMLRVIEYPSPQHEGEKEGDLIKESVRKYFNNNDVMYYLSFPTRHDANKLYKKYLEDFAKTDNMKLTIEKEWLNKVGDVAYDVIKIEK